MENLISKLEREARKAVKGFNADVKKFDKEHIINSWFYKNLMTPATLKKLDKLSKKELVNTLIERYEKRTLKRLEEDLLKVSQVKESKDIQKAVITIEWVKNRTWGGCPKATLVVDYTDNTREHIEGTRATGCGYDKESAAAATVLNKCGSILKLLYTQKNRPSKVNKENRSALGYGSGHGILPQFEGGVGINCFGTIFSKLGYKFENSASGKTFDVYTLSK